MTPSPTENPTNTPPATPACVLTGIFCELNQPVYHAGDHFLLSVTACNTQTTAVNAEVYVILDVYGSYWFWPGWTQTIDSELWTLPPRNFLYQEVLDFMWPAGTGAATGINFWAAMLQPGTLELIGETSKCSFDYQ